MRQNGLRYAHQAKQIHLENAFDLADIEIFEESTKTYTDELHEGINTAGSSQHRIDRRANLVFTCDVESQNLEGHVPSARCRRQRHLLRFGANGTIDTVPPGGQVQRRLHPHSGACSGDQSDFVSRPVLSAHFTFPAPATGKVK